MGTAIYLRISEDKQGLELGIDRQRDECRDLCQRRGWPDPVEYVDNDISASTGKHRPGYVDLVAAIRRGDITRVVVWHSSRVWRNRRERADGIELFSSRRVSLIPVKGPELDLTTAYGRFAADLIGSFDSAEGEIKSERIQATVRQRAKDGKLPGGGTRLYGYNADSTALVPDEAARMRTWYTELIAGRSVASVAREAGCWPTTMRDRFRNARYAGIRVYEGVEYPAAWPAIVDRATWEAACAILADPARTTNGRDTRKAHLGSGLYGCERCDRKTVYSAYYSNRGKSRHIYRCRPELGGCSRSWHRERLDAYVNLAVRERLGRGDLADLLPKDRPDLDALREEAVGIRGRLRKLRQDYVLLGMDVAELRESLTTGRARLAQIESELGDSTRGGVLGQLVACEDPVALWDAIPTDQVDRRQAIIRAIMTITLTGAPKGKPPTDWDESVLWFGNNSVKLGPPIA